MNYYQRKYTKRDREGGENHRMKLNTLEIDLARAKLGVSQTELAEAAGISRVWLGILLKRGEASADIVVKLAAALGVSPGEIINEG